MGILYQLARSDWELKRATEGASGYDLQADIEEPILLNEGQRRLIPTGLRLEIPRGVEGQIRSRSGLSYKRGVIVLNQPGTIDSDYRGIVGVLLANLGAEPYVIEPGERIAQIVFAPVLPDFFDYIHENDSVAWIPKRVREINETARGAAGFGSTGK